MATRRTESLPRCRWLPAVRARRRNGPSQGKVEKEPEQVRDERCDQCPEDGRHASPPGICIDITQAENPDCDHNGRHNTEAFMIVSTMGTSETSPDNIWAGEVGN